MSKFPDEMLTGAEVAEYARVCEATVRRWARNGVVPAVQIGKVTRFRRADIDALFTPILHKGSAPTA